MGRRSTFYFRSEHLSVSVGPPRPRVVPPARCREDVRAPVVVAGTAVSLELAGEAKLSPSRPTCHATKTEGLRYQPQGGAAWDSLRSRKQPGRKAQGSSLFFPGFSAFPQQAATSPA